jgi:DNA-directed RNA polymerase specialized sigma24 family protein
MSCHRPIGETARDAEPKGAPHMPPKRVDLPDSVRAAVLADVRLSFDQAVESDVLAKIRIYLATEQGLTQDDLAAELGVTRQGVGKWVRQGREALARRKERQSEEAGNRDRGDDPDRSGEPEPVG